MECCLQVVGSIREKGPVLEPKASELQRLVFAFVCIVWITFFYFLIWFHACRSCSSLFTKVAKLMSGLLVLHCSTWWLEEHHLVVILNSEFTSNNIANVFQYYVLLILVLIYRNIKEIAKLRGSEELWEVAKLHNCESSFPSVPCPRTSLSLTILQRSLARWHCLTAGIVWCLFSTIHGSERLVCS